MDWESNTYYIDLCRLCLSESGTCTIHEISHLPRDIFICTGIEVIISDKLPKKICNNCYNVIKKAIDFRDLASKNDLHLKSLCGNGKELLSEDLVSSTISNIENKSKYFNREEENKELQKKDIINPDNQKDVSEKVYRISIRKDLFRTSTQSSLDKKDDIQECTNRQKKSKKVKSTEILEYRCGVCRRNFETWKKLYLHSRIHNKNIVCSVESCSKMFATKGDLEKHLRIHTGEKPYECKICERKFTQKSSLRTHMMTVHMGVDD